MPVLERSLRYLFIPIVITFLYIVITQHLSTIWQGWLPKINELPYFLLGISAVLALLFNCWRISYLSLLLLGYYYFESSPALLPELALLSQEQVILTGTLIITFFATFKDRALFSIYFFKTVLAIGLCVILTLGWSAVITHLSSVDAGLLPNTLKLLTSLYAPIGISCIVLCIFTIWRATGVDSAIMVTLFIWLFHFYLPDELPLSILLTILALAYLTSILVRSHNLAYRDELTGLASRRSLNTLAHSLNKHYCLAMVDIDHFKKFNDTYGHDVGDQVLQLVAKKLSKVEGGGKVFRYGGEEFTIVFTNKNIEAVLPLLEEIRRKISQYNIVLRNQRRKNQSKLNRDEGHKTNPVVNITISIGVAEQHGETSFENTLKRADKALYKAKNNGRNQVFA
ncbi:GGDEF domain-containing protein [Shewanella pealeana]|uniref:diguanylate cyclase n=1 Tax=Shewanella pealeana (strain ATCC 700345 / ANG-SQ1) TaxID=398579 RepID=A8H9R4_SHEPA|nr:GGDEF domain-containing protein [Shewanella pealeana]ABV89301.1 diguanylate cyclase [Shewanella pealeana ATCC 700345]